MSVERGSKDQGVQLAVMEGLDHKGIQGKMVTWERVVLLGSQGWKEPRASKERLGQLVPLAIQDRRV